MYTAQSGTRQCSTVASLMYRTAQITSSRHCFALEAALRVCCVYSMRPLTQICGSCPRSNCTEQTGQGSWISMEGMEDDLLFYDEGWHVHFVHFSGIKNDNHSFASNSVTITKFKFDRR